VEDDEHHPPPSTSVGMLAEWPTTGLMHISHKQNILFAMDRNENLEILLSCPIEHNRIRMASGHVEDVSSSSSGFVGETTQSCNVNNLCSKLNS